MRIFFLTIILFIYAYPSVALEQLKIDATSSSSQARITFYCKQPVNFNADLKADAIHIKFNRRFTTNFSSLLANTKGFIIGATISKDGSNIILALNRGNYTLRKFFSDKSVGVDLIRKTDKQTAPTSLHKEKPKTPEKPIQQPKTEAKKAVNLNITAKEKPKTPEKTIQQLKTEAKKAANLNITAKEKPKTPEKTIQPPKTEAKKALNPNLTSKDNSETSEKPIQQLKTDTKQTVNTIFAAKDKSTITSNTEKKLDQSPKIDRDTPYLESKEESSNIATNTKLIFPWKSDVAAAAFYQAGYLWVIFNSPINIDLQGIKSSATDFIDDIKQLKYEDNAILYLKTKVPTTQIALYKDKYDWVLEFDNNKNSAPNSTNAQLIQQQPNSKVKGIFFPVVNMATPITFINPIIGNNIIVVPFYSMDSKVPNERQFVDFTLLSTIQGFAISIISDYVQLLTVNDGIEVLSIHSNIPQEIKEKQPEPSPQNPAPTSLLPYTKWYNLPPELFLQTRQKLQADIIASDKQTRPDAIFALSQFFLGKNYTKESAGMNEFLESVYPNFANNLEFKFSKGVSEYMNKRGIEAKMIFDTINLDQVQAPYQDEVKFWQDAATLALDIPTPQYNILQYKNSFLTSYPNIVLCNLASLDIRASFMSNKLEHVKQILDYLDSLNLNNSSVTEQCYNSMRFYSGLYEHKVGHNKKALKIWYNLADKTQDRLNSTRANFSIIKLLYELDKITIDEAITRLNKLRNSWRGNRLDARLLEYLANLYYKSQNYPETLRVWAELIRAFPRSSNIFFIKSKMSKLFVDLFEKDGLANKLAPFQAISLFFEFYYLLPIGKIGDDIIQNIAYILIKLDLLGKAEALLDHEITYRLTGEDRAKVATKLALIYLIDKKPAKVLEVLDKTYMPDLPEQLKNQRTYIKTQALIDDNKLKEAFSLIQNDQSEDAYQLKSNILWMQKNCNALEKLMLDQLDKSPHAPPFSSKEEEDLLHILLCYMAIHQQSNAETIYNSFRTYLSNSGTLHDTFNFIMGSTTPLDVDNLSKSLDISSMENFLDKYKNSLLLP